MLEDFLHIFDTHDPREDATMTRQRMVVELSGQNYSPKSSLLYIVGLLELFSMTLTSRVVVGRETAYAHLNLPNE